MPVDTTRTVRGALAGAAGAAVWAAQQPLDKRLFGVDHDDCSLLGTAVLRPSHPAAYPLGVAMHLFNGALFGAVYANLAPSLPGPRAARGPVVASVENLATWPLARFAHLHPASERLPRLWGNRAAFAQGVWRHLVFGTVLGELERRLNPPPEEPAPVDATIVASNGHGRVEHLVGA